MTNIQLADGLILLQARLSPAEQRDLWALCRALADGPVPMYTPTVRGGKKMSVGMLCLGKHWNGLTYKYEDRRSDFETIGNISGVSADNGRPVLRPAPTFSRSPPLAQRSCA